MDTEFVTTAETIRLLCEIILKKGMTKAELSRKTGLDLSKMADPDTLFPLDDLLTLWEIAVDITQDTALALHLRNYFPRERTHFLVRIFIYSRNLMEAARHWTQYNNMITSSSRFEILDKEEGIIIRFVNLSPKHASVRLPEYDLSMAIHLARYLTKTPINPVEVRLQYPDPGYAGEYEKFFKSPILFEHRYTELVMKKKDMMREIDSYDPYLQSVVKKIAHIRTRRTEFQSSEAAVVHYIKNCLERGQINFEIVAKAMNMDRALLSRKLKSEGITFKQILESTRKDLATQYLKQDLASTQISYLLGFSQSSSFHHAFLRWFGISIREYRQKNLETSDT